MHSKLDIRHAITAGLCVVLLTACAHDLGDAKTTGCPAPCPTGTSCDPQSGVCARPGSLPYQDKGCMPPSVTCGRVCADLTRDPENCGACGLRCGPHAVCKEACTCEEGFVDCNGSWLDGCECDGECDGTGCMGAQQCSPSQADSCGDETAYCESNALECTACPAGTRNCDGTFGCEHTGASCKQPPPTPVPVPECSYDDTNVCGGADDQWCTSAGACKSCSPSFFNCDGTKGCECKYGCDGITCAATP